MKFEIHVDAVPAPHSGGKSFLVENFFVEVHWDANPEWRTNPGRVEQVTFDHQTESPWTLSYITNCVVEQLKTTAPEVFHPDLVGRLAKSMPEVFGRPADRAADLIKDMSVAELLDAVEQTRLLEAKLVKALMKYAKTQATSTHQQR